MNNYELLNIETGSFLMFWNRGYTQSLVVSCKYWVVPLISTRVSGFGQVILLHTLKWCAYIRDIYFSNCNRIICMGMYNTMILILKGLIRLVPHFKTKQILWGEFFYVERLNEELIWQGVVTSVYESLIPYSMQRYICKKCNYIANELQKYFYWYSIDIIWIDYSYKSKSMGSFSLYVNTCMIYVYLHGKIAIFVIKFNCDSTVNYGVYRN